MERFDEMNLKDLFVEMKNISELVVDLAYSSILFDSEEMADEVEDLEKVMNDLNFQIKIKAILSARNLEDAKRISEILEVAGAIEDISNHANNISRIVSEDLKVHSVVLESLKDTTEKISKVLLREKSPLVGMSIKESKLASRVGSYIIAIKRGKRWIYNPRKNQMLMDGDLLFLRGTQEGIQITKQIAEGLRSKW